MNKLLAFVKWLRRRGFSIVKVSQQNEGNYIRYGGMEELVEEFCKFDN